MTAKARPVWHVISSDDLLAMLRRVQAGEDPEFVYLEEYVNADHEPVEGSEETGRFSPEAEAWIDNLNRALDEIAMERDELRRRLAE